jgi:hypothetical protein
MWALPGTLEPRAEVDLLRWRAVLQVSDWLEHHRLVDCHPRRTLLLLRRCWRCLAAQALLAVAFFGVWCG